MKRWALLLILGAIVSGCAMPTLPANPANMTAEQIKEWVRDKSAAINCGAATHPYGRVALVSINLDKAVAPNVVVELDGDTCKTRITTTTPEKGK